jgi:hypothetical protein
MANLGFIHALPLELFTRALPAGVSEEQAAADEAPRASLEGCGHAAGGGGAGLRR